MKNNSLSCLALQYSSENGNMGLPRMPSDAFRKPDYLCLQNGSTLRNSAAPMAWEQSACTSQSSSARALGLSMCAW